MNSFQFSFQVHVSIFFQSHLHPGPFLVLFKKCFKAGNVSFFQINSNNSKYRRKDFVIANLLIFNHK